MTKRLSLLLAICCVLVFHAHSSQAQDLVAFSTSYFAPATLAEPVSGAPELEVDVMRYDFEAWFWQTDLGNDWRILHGLSGQYMDLSYQNDPSPGQLQYADDIGEGLAGGAYRMLIRHQFSSDWIGLAVVSPGFYTDAYNGVDKNSFQVQGGVFAVRMLSGHSDVTFGARYSSQLGRPMLLPMLGYTYKASQWHVMLMLPSNAEWMWQFSETFSAGLAVELDGYNYWLSRSLNEGFNIEYAQMTAGPKVEVALGSYLRLRLSGGMAAGLRMYKVYDRNEDLFSDNELDPSLFVRATLAVPVSALPGQD